MRFMRNKNSCGLITLDKYSTKASSALIPDSSINFGKCSMPGRKDTRTSTNPVSTTSKLSHTPSEAQDSAAAHIASKGVKSSHSGSQSTQTRGTRENRNAKKFIKTQEMQKFKKSIPWSPSCPTCYCFEAPQGPRPRFHGNNLSCFVSGRVPHHETKALSVCNKHFMAVVLVSATYQDNKMDNISCDISLYKISFGGIPSKRAI